MKLKKVLAGLLAATLLIGATSTSVLATGANTGNTGNVVGEYIAEYGPDEQAKAKAGIGKALATGKGNSIESIKDIEYEFQIEFIPSQEIPDGAEGNEVTHTSKATGPQLGNKKGDSTTIGTVKTKANANKETVDATDYYRNNASGTATGSDNILHNFISKLDDGDASGIYVYKVTELVPETLDGWKKKAGSTNVFERKDVVEGENKFNDTLTYSQAEYMLRVYVKFDGTNNYISAITAYQTKTDTNETVTKQGKVDVTFDNTTESFKLSGMKFQNNFQRQMVTDPDDPEGQPWELTKKVTNVDGDALILHGDSTTSPATPAKKFDFTITLTKAEGSELGATYTDARKFTSDDGNTWTKDEDFSATFNFGTGNTATLTVQLAHDEKITFPELPTGTMIKVVEADYFTAPTTGSNIDPATNEVRKYTFKPIIKTTVGDNDPTSTTEPTAAPTEEERTSEVTVSADPTSTDYENKGSYDTGTTPTGILMNNLPFFVIIALAVVALLGFTVVKGSRRNRVR